jgi:hypothetical protein
METGWIQIFVLTLTQCIAPAGKMVCQEESVEFQFADQVDCEVALVQMLDVAARVDSVIVIRERSNCRAMTKEVNIFASANEAGEQYDGASSVAATIQNDPPPDFTQSAHQERLKSLYNCDEVAGVAPCKIGEIIIEAAQDDESTQVWRRQN